jgi:1-hydroxycarotenoid 3,4-desaturase
LTQHVVIIGAGIAGLTAAVDLARQGIAVTVLERAAAPGGKMREVEAGGVALDGGPTVFTMRWVFDALFAEAGSTLAEHLTLTKADILARHAWSDTERLDLFADPARTEAAIGDFAGAAEARGYRAFREESARIYRTLEHTFITAPRPTALSLMGSVAKQGVGGLWSIRPFDTMWAALGRHFRDPRLRQLFGRYATYCGSSPFLAPATLMLVAHVEQEGVWLVEGGMHRLAAALAGLATHHGATIRYGAEVAEVVTGSGRATGVRLANGEFVAAGTVVVNADASAVAAGLLGAGVRNAVPPPTGVRSLSAVTWAMQAETDGFPLSRHTVFFSRDYQAEFDAIARGALPGEPTVYVCAQDRDDAGTAQAGPERLLVLVNAPAMGDTRPFPEPEIAACADRTFHLLQRCGLRVRPTAPPVVTTPVGFNQLFPGTGGALYGQATHGPMASFARPGSRSAVPGLYLAGGSVHPGAGVPMAALSGRLAASRVMADLGSTRRSRPAAMRGGMSMR